MLLSNKRMRQFLHFILGGLVIIMFAIGPKVRGFKSGIERWIFNGDKNS
jgi:hypothetical protein